MKHLILGSASALAILLSACSGSNTDPEQVAISERPKVRPVQAQDPYYALAQDAVHARMAAYQPKKAKNVILFIGDGMSISTITAGRIYAGQKQGLDGESFKLAMDKMPHAALSRTYAHDSQVSDSASTATALVTGVKTDVRTLGLTEAVEFNNCLSQDNAKTQSVFELAEMAGLATGIISTARITHATPASTYSQSASRDWEDDADMPAAIEAGCKDIAAQLIDWPYGDGFEFVMGGGRAQFTTEDMPDKERENWSGNRTDGKDLVLAWDRKSDDHVVVFDQEGFDSLDFSTPVRPLGLFESSHMQFELDRIKDVAGEPSLAEMTAAAITRLSQDEDGYILMVEGGRIDHAHHGTNAARALEDTVAFDDAIAKAIEMAGDDTLIIATADHSHTMTISGYPKRNNPILGKVTYATGALAKGQDGKPYATLSYANGPEGCRQVDGEQTCERSDLKDVDTTAPNFRQQALVFMPSETHAGEDVAILAQGPGSALVGGIMDQNEVFHVIAYSLDLIE